MVALFYFRLILIHCLLLVILLQKELISFTMRKHNAWLYLSSIFSVELSTQTENLLTLERLFGSYVSADIYGIFLREQPHK